MLTRFFRHSYERAVEAHAYNGYSEVYEHLISKWTQESVWSAGLFGLFLIVYIYALPLFEQKFSNLTVLAVVAGLGGYVVLATFMLLIYSLALSIFLSPLKEVPTLTVRILTSVNKPHCQPYTGLTYREIHHLRRMAEIEQDSADWRGSFVNIVIIGTISVIVWGAPFAWRFLSEPASSGAIDADYLRYKAAIAPLIPAPASDGAIYMLIGIGVGFVFLLTTSFLSYFRRFLSSETANRVVLKACEEALAFLEKFNLTEHTVFSYHEKRAIAAHFGCKIVHSEKAAFADQLWTWGYEPDGTIWYLVPPVRNSRIQDIRLKIHKSRMWISTKVFKGRTGF